MKNDPPFELGKVRVVEVIELESCRGKGTDVDPIRNVRTYWTLAGSFLAEYDVADYMPSQGKEGGAP